MTRTGLSPRLSAHISEPSLWIHPDDAHSCGLDTGDFAKLDSLYGQAILKVIVSDAEQKGTVFAPIHWSAETASYGRIGAVVSPKTDPFSGQPELKATPCQITCLSMTARGFMLSRAGTQPPEGAFWTKVMLEHGEGLLFATSQSVSSIAQFARKTFSGAELIELMDETRGIYRCAAILAGKLIGALFIGPNHDAPVWNVVKAAFTDQSITHSVRKTLLANRQIDGIDQGAIICACFGVGLTSIRAAFLAKKAVTLEDIGQQLKAGTNCGSCLPELKRIGAACAAESPDNNQNTHSPAARQTTQNMTKQDRSKP